MTWLLGALFVVFLPVIVLLFWLLAWLMQRKERRQHARRRCRPLGMNLRICASFLVGFLAVACADDDVLDHIENGAWDAAAAKVSAWCAKANAAPDTLWWQRSRIEARREIRQRGTNGPLPPIERPAGLDDATTWGKGPVLVIWCAGETDGQGTPYPVPVEVWSGMVRNWRD